jgi:hypothetical protein
MGKRIEADPQRGPQTSRREIAQQS